MCAVADTNFCSVFTRGVYAYIAMRSIRNNSRGSYYFVRQKFPQNVYTCVFYSRTAIIKPVSPKPYCILSKLKLRLLLKGRLLFFCGYYYGLTFMDWQTKIIFLISIVSRKVSQSESPNEYSSSKYVELEQQCSSNHNAMPFHIV